MAGTNLRIIRPAADAAPATAPDGDRRARVRRRAKRLRVSKKVDYELEGRRIFGFTKDLSSSGMFLRTSRTLPLGTDATFWISVENNTEPIEIEGKITRVSASGTDAGMAIAFEKSKAEALEAIEHFVLNTLEETAKRQLGSNGRNTRALREIGEICEEKHEPDEALKHYSAVLAIEPNAFDMKGRVGLLTLVRAEAGSDETEVIKALSLLEDAAASDAQNEEWKAGLAHARKLVEKVRGKRKEDEQKLRDDEAAKKRQAERRAAELEGRESELAKAHADIAKAQAALAKAQKAQEEAKEELAKAQAEHKRNAEALHKEKSELAGEQKRLAKLEKDVSARGAEIETLQRDIAAEKERTAQREKENNKEKKNLAAQREQLEQEQKALLKAAQQREAEQHALADAAKQIEASRAALAAERTKVSEALAAERAHQDET